MKTLFFVMLLFTQMLPMEKPEQQTQDLEAQKTDCCNPEDKEVKESCTKMKVAIITGITGLVSTGITAATILIVQSADPK